MADGTADGGLACLPRRPVSKAEAAGEAADVLNAEEPNWEKRAELLAAGV